MVEAQFNYFDMAVIGIMFLSCLFAFFRGFVREILSLTAWIGAGAITIYYFPALSQNLKQYFATPLATSISTVFILYVGSLICFAIFNRYIIKILRSGSEIGIFDNILGLAFGALRGAFIISLAYFMLSLAIPAQKRPDWLAKAITQPYAEKGALMLTKIAPERLKDLSDLQTKTVSNLQDASKKAIIEEGTNTSDNPDDPQVKIIRHLREEGNKSIEPKDLNEILSTLKNSSNRLNEQQ